jgi:acyl carrier protein
MKTSDQERARNAVNAAVQEVTGEDIAEAPDGATLEALGIDSLDLIEIGMLVEEEFDVLLETDAFDDVTTVGEVCEVIAKQLNV